MLSSAAPSDICRSFLFILRDNCRVTKTFSAFDSNLDLGLIVEDISFIDLIPNKLLAIFQPHISYTSLDDTYCLGLLHYSISSVPMTPFY